MTIRNRGHQIVKQLRENYGVSVIRTRDGALLLTAIDSRGVSDEATRLARVFKTKIIQELERKKDHSNTK